MRDAARLREITAQAAHAATTKIPIVFNVGGDPVKFGLVASLNHPGGNATGVTSFLSAMASKRFGLLRELVPKVNLIAVLVNPNDPAAQTEIGDLETAARRSGNNS